MLTIDTRHMTRTRACILSCAVLTWPTADATAQFSREFRTIDGANNNTAQPEWGSADIDLLRLTYADYEDGTEQPAGRNRPSARTISNAVAVQRGSRPNSVRASDFVWQWGQFLDHDISLTAVMDPPEPFDIPVPQGDPFFDPLGTGRKVIPLNRSFFRTAAGTREQVNEITTFIDASNVYGSDPARASELRTLDGTGRLKTSDGRMLPFNLNGFPNAPHASDPSFFLAGDVRANEHVTLTAMHTLFVQEHNYWAERIRQAVRSLSGEEIYQLARAIVGAEMQTITYNEFLPVLLGSDALGPYSGYAPGINPGIGNEFSTAAYRFGHSMVSPVLLRLRSDGKPIDLGHLPLAKGFFNPDELIHTGGLEPLLRGLASHVAQDVDPLLIDEVRNFLFGPPGAGGFDLAALNIQRGRDHGLPGYNQVRVNLGLPPAVSFADISPDPVIQTALASVYSSVEDVDLWVGGLAEAHVPDALVGETFFLILKEQFERLRGCDRYWYDNYLPWFARMWVESQTLAKIIRRNTQIGKEIQDNVFVVRGR